MEQVRGIEPPCSAWEADILPLNYTCMHSAFILYHKRGVFARGKIAGKLPEGSKKNLWKIFLLCNIMLDRGKRRYYNESIK